MIEKRSAKVDTKEFELPETTFISDIDAKVFQGIVLQTLSSIDGIFLAEGTFIDNILGRSAAAVGSGVYSEQDHNTHSVNIKVDVDIQYGLSIPDKAEEIRTKVTEEITRLTGLHVASFQIHFKNIIPPDQTARMLSAVESLKRQVPDLNEHTEPHYTEDF
jgi:uncharacterized alkaline shock family protein YloU